MQRWPYIQVRRFPSVKWRSCTCHRIRPITGKNTTIISVGLQVILTKCGKRHLCLGALAHTDLSTTKSGSKHRHAAQLKMHKAFIYTIFGVKLRRHKNNDVRFEGCLTRKTNGTWWKHLFKSAKLRMTSYNHKRSEVAISVRFAGGFEKFVSQWFQPTPTGGRNLGFRGLQVSVTTLQ